MKIKAVVDTALYVDDLQATETFYRTVLGLQVIGKEPGRHVFFQVGRSNVLLAFLADATLKGDPLPLMGPPGRAILPWALRRTHSTPGGRSCTARGRR